MSEVVSITYVDRESGRVLVIGRHGCAELVGLTPEEVAFIRANYHWSDEEIPLN